MSPRLPNSSVSMERSLMFVSTGTTVRVRHPNNFSFNLWMVYILVVRARGLEYGGREF